MTRQMTGQQDRQVRLWHSGQRKAGRRFGDLGAAILVAGLLAAAACGNTCPAQTIVVTVTLVDDSVVGDDLLVEVFQDQTPVKQGFVTRGDGRMGRIEVFLGATYQEGKSLNLKVTSRLKTVPVGWGTAWVTLANSCSSVDVRVSKAPTENWSCLNSLDLSQLPPEGEPPAGRTIKVHDLSDRPIPQTTAMACPPSAVGDDCTDPVWASTSSTGDFQVGLSNSFKGYIKLTAPGYIPGYLELVRFFGYMQARPTILLAKWEEFQVMARIASAAALKQDRGHIVLATTDCSGKRVGGIGFMFDGMASTSFDDPQLFILVNNLNPSNNEQLKQTAPNGDKYLVTDPTGTAILLNVPTEASGFFTIRPYHVKTGTWFNYINPRVRPGALTYVAVEPN